jgi:hypothetical protein
MARAVRANGGMHAAGVGERFPVYAVFAFAKNEREDLSNDQKRALMRVVADIKAQARTRTGR